MAVEPSDSSVMVGPQSLGRETRDRKRRRGRPRASNQTGSVREYHRDVPDIAIVLVVILVIVLVARGPKTLPQLGEALGKAVSGARKAAREGDGKDDGPEDQAAA